MVLKLIDATQARPGVVLTIDGEPYSVKSNDINKTRKHIINIQLASKIIIILKIILSLSH